MAALNLGELSISIGANTEALKDIVPIIKSLEGVMKNLENSVNKLNDTMSKAYEKVVSGAVKASNATVKAANDQAKANSTWSMLEKEKAKQVEQGFKAIEAARKQEQALTKSANAAAKTEIKEYEAELDKQAKALQEAADKQKKYNESIVNLKLQQAIDSNKQLTKELDKVSYAAKQAAQTWQEIDQAHAEAIQMNNKFNASMQQQQKAISGAELEVDRLAKKYDGIKGGQVHIQTINKALEDYRTTLSKGVLSQEQFLKAQQAFKKTVEGTKLATYDATKPLNVMQETLNELGKTAVVALGPLSGVASRITAIAAVVNRQNISFALLVGMFAGFTVLLHKAVIESAAMESQLLKMDNALRFTGNGLGITAKELNNYAEQLALSTLTSKAFARESAIALTAFRGISKQAFPEVLALAQDLSATMGGSLLENTKRLGQVMESPIEALGNLGESGVRFTKSQKDIAESFVRTGEAAKASAYIIEEIRKRVGGAGEAEAKGLAGAWDTLSERLTSFVEKVGLASNESGSLTDALNEIANTVKYYTENTDVAKDIATAFAASLKLLAGAAKFLVDNIQAAIFVGEVFLGVYSLRKLIQAYKYVIDLTKGLNLLTVATKLTTLAHVKYEAVLISLWAAQIKFNAAVMRNPYVAAAVAITTVVGGLMYWANSANEANNSQQTLNKSVQDSVTNYDEIIKKQKQASAGLALTGLETSLKTMEGLLANVKDKLKLSPDNTALKAQEKSLVSMVENTKKKIYDLGYVAQGLDIIPESAREFSAMLGQNVELIKKFVPSPDAENEWKKLKEAAVAYNKEAAKGVKHVEAIFRSLDKNASDESIAKQAKEFMQLNEAMQYAVKTGSAFKSVTDNWSKIASDLVNNRKYFEEFAANGKESADKLKKELDLTSWGNELSKQIGNTSRPVIEAIGSALSMKGIKVNTGPLVRLDQAVKNVVNGLVEYKRQTEAIAESKALEDSIEKLIKPIVRARQEMDMLAQHGEFAVKKLKDSFEIQDLDKSLREGIGTWEQYAEAVIKAQSEGVNLSDTFNDNISTTHTLQDKINQLVAALLNVKIAAQQVGDAQARAWDSSGIVAMQNKLNDVNLQMDVMDKMTLGDKFMNMFDTAPLDKMIQKQKDLESRTVDFAILKSNSPEGFTAAVANIEAAAKRYNVALGSMDTPQAAAEGLQKLIDKAEEAPAQFKAVADAVSNIAGQASSLFGQLSSMYAEQASYHKQMADDALSYGRDQAQLYMELADAVHYSNNVQAKSFEDKAIAAAESAAKQYEVEKKAQAQANALAKNAFENQKKLQIAQATASTAVAVMQTYTNSGLGIFATPLAIAMGALGAAQVAMIQQQQYTPRANGGSIVGGKAYVTSEQGPEIFVPGRSGTMISQKEIMEGLTGGGSGSQVNVNFTIQAIDTQSAAQVIAANKGMIVNMVRQATNKEMRR